MALALVLVGCSATGSGGNPAGITIEAGFAFAPPTTSEAAAYFTIVNSAATPDSLLGVSSPLAAQAGLHHTTQSDGMMQMQAMGPVVIAAHDSLVMKPGTTHLMLTSLNSLPRVGDTITVTLRFSHAGMVTVPLPVRAYGDPATEAP
jgi:periplasmic copper chaperone A